MASNTTRLGLLKKDPTVDGADTFNIKTMLNDNWDSIDEKVALIDPVTGKLKPSQIEQDKDNRFMKDTERTKLASIETGANKYIHPETHPPSAIAQDANNRFVSDAEKTIWNSAKNDAINWAKDFGVGGAKSIPSGSDLNNLVEPGDYYFGSGSILNNPAGQACFIRVTADSGARLVTQEVYAIYKNDKYIRSRSAALPTSPWNPWDSFVTSASPKWLAPTLQNGWVSAFADRPPRYAVVGNLLYIKGTVKNGANGDSSPVFTLPVGYRPSEYRSVAVATLGSAASGYPVNRLGVSPGGGVAIAWNYNVEAVGIDAVIPL